MKNRKVLYIGNNLRGNHTNVTTIETLSQQLQSIGYEVRCYSSVKNKVLRIFNMLYGVIKHGKRSRLVLIDTYSTQNFYYAVAVGNLCRLLKIPYAPILHGGDLPHRLQHSKSNSFKLFNGAEVNIAPSRYLMEAFKREGYTNLLHIPNTIELANYTFLERVLKGGQEGEDGPKLLWVRSFADIYNPMLALQIVDGLLLKFPKITLTMVGPDKDGSLELCQDYAKKKNLPVTFTGKLSKKEWCTLAQNFHLFINTTNFDNMPVSVIEAMALGLPVISTNVGGIPYLIEEGKDGLLVPVNEVLSFTAAVEKLYGQPHLYQSIAANARQKVARFDWEKVKLQWQELLGE